MKNAKQKCSLCQAMNASIQCNFMSFWHELGRYLREREREKRSYSFTFHCPQLFVETSIAMEQNGQRTSNKWSEKNLNLKRNYVFIYVFYMYWEMWIVAPCYPYPPYETRRRSSHTNQSLWILPYFLSLFFSHFPLFHLKTNTKSNMFCTISMRLHFFPHFVVAFLWSDDIRSVYML